MTTNKKGVNDLLSTIRKQYGAESIYSLGKCGSNMAVDSISTGHFALDCITGIGGIPVGRITEVYGPESSGKTTLALKIAKQATDNGKTVAFIDVEHALNAEYALKIGIDPEKVLISQPDSGEEALGIIEHLAKSGQCDLIVLDSVAALTTKSEIEGSMGAHNVGSHARLMSLAIKKLNPLLSNKTSIVFINQLRMKIGVLFGSPEVTTGGNALKFYSSLRMEVRRGTVIKEGDKQIGHMMRVKIVKNKMAAPFRQAEIAIFYKPQDSCIEEEVLSTALQYNVVTSRGGWYYYNEEKIGHGKEKACAYLAENADILSSIQNDIMAIL